MYDSRLRSDFLTPRRFGQWAAVTFGMLSMAGTVRATTPDPSPLTTQPEQTARARILVRQFGSPDYRQRDRAARELQQLGRLALPALTDGVGQAEDAEVRARCQQLLPAAEADDIAVRTAAFLADTAGRYDHGLPGWEPFRAAVGDTPAARLLFADMLKTPDNRALLAATSKPAPVLGRMILGRREQLRPKLTRPIASADVGGVVASVAALILAESMVPEKDAPLDGLPVHYVGFFYQKIGQEAVTGTGPTGPAFRKLALRWLDTRDGFDGAMYIADMAMGLDLPAENKARYAARVLSTRRPQPRDAARYLTMIAASEGREQLPIVTGYLSDEKVVVEAGQASPATIRVRDVALVAALRITGQDPKGYGMEARGGRDTSRFDPQSHWFRDGDGVTAEGKRDAALKKWKEWEAKSDDRPDNGKP